MRFTKFLAVAGAVSMLASAIPFAVSAEDEAQSKFEYRLKADGTAVITDVTTTEEEFKIPGTVTIGEGEEAKEATVVGVDDYAFVLCENLNVVNVPDSLTIADTGNVAFLTSSAIIKYLDGELSDAATIDDVIKYVAEKAKYKNGNYTDADLADLAVKVRNKVNSVDLSAAKTVEGKVALLVKSVNDLDISKTNKDNFNLWVAGVNYNGLTLKGSAETDMETYAKGKELIGMKYEATAAYVLGDANGDGVFNIRDAAWICIRRAMGENLTVETNPAADYNGDGLVNVRDAAAIAIHFSHID